MSASSSIRSIKRKLRIDTQHTIVCDDTYLPLSHIDIQGVRINYCKVSPTNTTTTGPALILIHGWSGAWYSWVRMAKHLMPTHTIYMVDLPGFGQSDRLPEYSIKIEAEYIAQFVQQLNIQKPTIIGLSMSAFIVSYLAQKCPKLLASAILLGPVFKTGRVNRLSNNAMHRIFSSIQSHKRAESFAKRTFDRRLVAHFLAQSIGMHTFQKELVDSYSLLSRVRMTQEAFIQMYISVCSTNMEELLEGTTIPIHLVFGSHDKLTSIDQARAKLAHTNGAFTFTVIPKCGHVVATECPEETAVVIEKLL